MAAADSRWTPGSKAEKYFRKRDNFETEKELPLPSISFLSFPLRQNSKIIDVSLGENTTRSQ